MAGSGDMRTLVWRAALVALAVSLAPALRAGAAEPVSVVLDQARILKLPDRVATVVIGNPLIADISIQSGGLLVVTGKGYGATNLVALDRSGNVLMERELEVRGGGEQVVQVFRGVERESYSCSPRCERRITLGDAKDFFETTLKQTSSRNAEAAAAGAGR
jgi:Flp pilus assembly secretin CpaC